MKKKSSIYTVLFLSEPTAVVNDFRHDYSLFQLLAWRGTVGFNCAIGSNSTAAGSNSSRLSGRTGGLSITQKGDVKKVVLLAERSVEEGGGQHPSTYFVPKNTTFFFSLKIAENGF